MKEIISSIKTVSGWSGARIAKELQVSQPVVSRILTNKSPGSIGTLRKALDLEAKLKNGNYERILNGEK